MKQDYRNVKSTTNAMPSFKRFRNASTTVAGIESMPAFARGNFARIACTSKMPPCLPPGIWSSLLDKVS
ncbi:hypothetical protein [Paraburkholderia strydomiana]|uniref:hypothetical protein n=1 Tax=Paraburkholderia strydomiana TaxID=1245417 RepID=UPI0038B77A40